MPYMENFAPKRENPITDRVEAAASSGSASNQQSSVAQSTKFRTVGVDSSKYNAGNQVRLQANDKGTGVFGKPSAIALAGKDSAESATANPSGTGNKPGANGTAN